MGDTKCQGKKVSAWPLALIRIFTGIFFIYISLMRPWEDTSNLEMVFKDSVNQLPSYLSCHKEYMEKYVFPNWGYVNYAIIFGELGIGILLFFGLLSRLTSLFGMVLMAFYFFSLSLTPAAKIPADIGYPFAFFMIFFVFFLTGPGRVLGIDGLIFCKK